MIWTAQPDGVIDYINQSWLKYSGQSWEEALNGSLAAVVYPDDLAQCLAEWNKSLQTAQPYQTEYRLRRADGSYRWHLARALPVRDDTGRIISWVGSCTDIDDQKRAEARLDFQASVLSQVNDVIIAVDNDFNIIYWNEPAAKLYEVNRSEIIGQPLEKAYQNLWASPNEEQQVMDTMQNGGHWRGEIAQIKTATGERIYVETSSSSLYDQDGRNRGLLAVMREITRRKISEEAVQLLADASAVLATSLNYRATLGSLAELVVGNLADWCIFDLRDESGKMQRVALAHSDPLKEPLLVDLVTRYPIYEGVDNPMSQVLATGQSQLVSAVDDKDLVTNASNQEHAKLWQQLNPRSTLIVPLIVQGQVCGIFSCVSTRANYYQPWHLALAQELARRASVSIENSQLFQQTQQALEAQRELDAAKDQFLSIASHELRTPLTVVRGYTQLLQRNYTMTKPVIW
jgi:PAS domain S-box-containing protein